MIYLVEIEAYDPLAGAVVVERFATQGYTTGPNDTPAHTHFEERVQDPGNFQRSVFEAGRTNGAASAGFGLIELANADGGIDRMARYAVDGRALRITALADERSPFASRVGVLAGTMQQMEFGWRRATVRLRDRMAALNEPLQKVVYAGTTVAGGMDEAEGAEDDLKDKPKPTLWGRVLNVSPILANRFDLIWQASSRPLASVEAVRDNGVPISFQADYASIATLRAAAIPAGRYGTCLSLGLLRTGSVPSGDLTVDVTEGAAGQRSAALVSRRILEAAGFVAGADFVASDFDTLHAVNPAEVGTWTGLDRRDVSAVLSSVLASVGAWIVPDRLGRFRVRRLDAPVFDADAPVLDRALVLDRGDGIERLATADDGSGVPAAKVTMRYARNWTIQSKATLDATAATAAMKAFAAEEYRNALAEDAAVRERHLLATEPSFDSAFVNLADAQAEAQRRLGIYGVRRDRYRVPVPRAELPDIDLGDVVTLAVDRFDLAGGKPFVVLGEDVTLVTGTTVLDLYG
ncbi:hypothetical protein [Aureimonas mangrovi]|uniref:hypothetical protein n=1 Tax=Aureimonas mangrovi TaxID=2758041 RepID=UPI00163DDBB8|nr:hypothetical protein [Aureimonas mangrovi]